MPSTDTRSVITRVGAPPPRRIAILRALQLGDLLCAVPAWRALRAAFPRAHVTLIGLPWARGLAARYARYLDGFLEFPGYPGLPERPPAIHQIPAFLEDAQRRRWDLLLQIHGDGSITNPLAASLGARRIAGFYRSGDYCPDPGRFLVYPAGTREVRRHLRLMRFLGIPLQGEHLEFPIGAADEHALREIPEAGALAPGGYVCVHPGGRSARRWPPERFAAVADALAARDLQIVLTGVADERDTARAVARAMRTPALDLAGRTTLGALAVLLARARLLVCNDTGVSHLAAALRTPSVIVFTTSDPARWAPLDRSRHRIAGPPPAPITPDAVLAQAAALLGRHAGPRPAPRFTSPAPGGAHRGSALSTPG
jgi:ADP-heptose:LPS heptosyltransferase